MIYYVIAVSFLSFILFGIDKWKAKKHQRRISELALLAVSLLGGSLASIIAMLIFNHKISKPSFWLKLVVVMILQSIIIIYVLSNYK